MTEIITELSDSILRVQFNRPDKKNALTMGMYTTLADLLKAANTDDAIRVVVLHGAGDSFSAGNDLGDFLDHPPKGDDSPQSRFVQALIDLDKPLIAAVHGAAVGSGTTMLTHCDFVYATERTTFQLPFVNLALVPELGTSYSLPAQIGYVAAAELVLLGSPFDARRAAQLGLVTRIVLETDLLATALDTAHKLARQPAGAVQASKRLLKRSSHKRIATAVKAENQEFALRVRSAEAREAIAAFFEKHRPARDKTQSTAALAE
jgi:enoyl-CoA hydratase/carnithine racemase